MPSSCVSIETAAPLTLQPIQSPPVACVRALSVESGALGPANLNALYFFRVQELLWLLKTFYVLFFGVVVVCLYNNPDRPGTL